MSSAGHSVELLAPARDLACGQAAFDCGADAVYMGASRFGAREAAGNSFDDIATLAAYAHTFWGKVYVTLNTLLYDRELPEAERMAWAAYEAGADGLIIQDVGLLESHLPPLPLIASTQMHNHTPARVAFLEAVGFQRAILARELTLDEIRAIRTAAPAIELECFVHGALCVGYSGQCGLSYALGGRSGNRGQCAQPCRKPYRLLDARGNPEATARHYLCLRDLALHDHLDALLDAGVCSFKIEGRLKDSTYVANVTAAYRERIDAALKNRPMQKSSSGSVTLSFTPSLGKTFNRGYTPYFHQGRPDAMASFATPKMIGEPVGRIVRMGREITLDTDTDLHPGDGISFFDETGALRGTQVNAAQGNRFTPDKPEGLRPGLWIYRNHDHVFLGQIRREAAQRRITVRLTLAASEDGLVLSIEDEDGISVKALSPGALEPARDPEQAEATLRRQLAKMGNTPYQCEAVCLDGPQAWFVPVARLNALRREALDALTTARLEQRPRRTGCITPNDAPFPEKTLTFRGNVLNARAEAFYRRHGVEQIEPAAEAGRDLAGQTVMITRYCLRHELGLCPKQSQARDAAPMCMMNEEGDVLELRFRCAQCHMEVILLRKNV